MRVREMTIGDLPRLQEIFAAQGLEYELPDLKAAEFIAKRGVVDESDVARMAVCARQTIELYMLADRNWSTPGMRLEALRALHADMRAELARLGFTDAHIWLPPQVEKSFGRRLMRDFHWTRPLWTDFTRKVVL